MPPAEQQIADNTTVETPAVETPPPATTEPTEGGDKSLLNKEEVPAFDAEKLTLPEGFEKGEHFDQFVEWSKEAGINQPQAEKLIGLYAEATQKQADALVETWTKQQETWQNEVKADKELGGTNLTNVKQTIAKVLDNPDLSDPKFREALDFTGAGNNPAVIRTLFRWAQKLTEGASVAGNPPARNGQGQLANQPQTLGDAMYGPQGPHSGGPRLG